jgi:hypothetical protein
VSGLQFVAALEGAVRDAELEKGHLDAVKMGLGEVARTLAEQLDGRWRARGGNVVALDPRRRSKT